MPGRAGKSGLIRVTSSLLVAGLLLPPQAVLARAFVDAGYAPGSALARVSDEAARIDAAKHADPAGLDLINPKNGNLFFQELDLTFGGDEATRVSLVRTYNSRSRAAGPFGLGWSMRFDTRIEADGHGGLRVTDADGFAQSFRTDGLDPAAARTHLAAELAQSLRKEQYTSGKFQSEAYYVQLEHKLATDDAYFDMQARRVASKNVATAGIFWGTARGIEKIVATKDGYHRAIANGAEERFDAQGRLVEIISRDGRGLRAFRNSQGRVSSILDVEGRSLVFRYEIGRAHV